MIDFDKKVQYICSGIQRKLQAAEEMAGVIRDIL